MLTEKDQTYFEYARQNLSAGNLLTDVVPRSICIEALPPTEAYAQAG